MLSMEFKMLRMCFKRPFSEVYTYYSDGEGIVETKDRSLHYCHKCKFKKLEPQNFKTI